MQRLARRRLSAHTAPSTSISIPHLIVSNGLRDWCVSPTGSFRAYTFWTLSEALSRLYQRRFLRPRPHFSAFFKLYIFSFAPFQISVIFQAFAPLFAKFVDFLRIFKEDSRFCRPSPNFNGILPEFRRISIILQRVMPRLLHFREI